MNGGEDGLLPYVPITLRDHPTLTRDGSRGERVWSAGRVAGEGYPGREWWELLPGGGGSEHWKAAGERWRGRRLGQRCRWS